MLKSLKTIRARALQLAAINYLPTLVKTSRRAVDSLRPVKPVEPTKQRQLLIDVSIIAAHDAGTGIQRVVRSILVALFKSPPSGLEMRLVKATRRRSYVYANDYSASLTGKAFAADSPVTVSSGDIFLGLDLSSRIAPRRQGDFLRWREQGVLCAFVVYDLLPALHPYWFTTRASRSFRHWLATIAIHADALICISQAVATDVTNHMEQKFGIPQGNVQVGWFHLGADPTPCADRNIFPTNRTDRIPRPAPDELVILMVGTIEPRKGYAQILDAFELLWQEGHTVKLVIVGRRGWHTDDLTARLSQHAEAGKRLRWISEADDAELENIYQTADGLAMASEAEGFGLPLTEAARYGMPLFVRDLAVFREVVGKYATYFRANNGQQLAPQLRQWLDAVRDGIAITSEPVVPLTWQTSAEQLKTLITRVGAANPCH
ncbi:glycosyltransferase family 4 protein [Paraburkholderia youngii]|uniref:glycosyltransferase family 4 protein n=1 Tax=Paraburkholderia youngii TaxID=2782701 RepID=UPI003D24D496